ncbi:MAG: hypothetical protein IPH07_36575 [Deltaproteobacteria bacterium]|nr:hypothetical protein [Deltaproteobacteria bacterium]MBK8235703.1 hypothetical protein [Deltaproteobacteria bacterium]MBK8713337.1 hypothetical protein [Deltaproteobacteria bacterium]MBP7289319.1 hypothetical protein [Nannocystaceae bacterium]
MGEVLRGGAACVVAGVLAGCGVVGRVGSVAVRMDGVVTIEMDLLGMESSG